MSVTDNVTDNYDIKNEISVETFDREIYETERNKKCPIKVPIMKLTTLTKKVRQQ